MLDQHPTLPSGALTLPRASEAPSRQPEVTFSDDHYESSTYQKWFARHTGLSLDEATTLGLARREHPPKWQTTRSPDGRWHLSKASTS